ncbi:hypothetical protein [Uliginosibacterium sediminicola]|uniref:Uncharacterized protein n=1 Tax=Uliginosibacterium sediminicola TaxID=2024550 RepID=A0ABU9Z2I7_9RHOO
MSTTFIRTTSDGRRIEVIDGKVCLDGRPEASELVSLDEHPNRQAIARAVPGATHVAGRLVFTLEEAHMVNDAMSEAKRELDLSPVAINRRLQEVMFHRAKMEGVE